MKNIFFITILISIIPFQVFSKVLKSKISLSESIITLGDQPYFDPKTGQIEYETESPIFLATDHEEKRIKRLNNKRRNEYMKEHEKAYFLGHKEINDSNNNAVANALNKEVKRVNKANTVFEQDISNIRASQRSTAQDIANDQKKLKEANEKRDAFFKKEFLKLPKDSSETDYTNQDLAGHRNFRENNPRLKAYSSTISDIESNIKSRRKSLYRQEKQLLAINTTASKNNSSLQKISKEISKNQSKLTRSKFLEHQQNLEIFGSASNVAKRMMKNLEDSEEFSKVLYRDLDSLKKDLGLSDLETKLLLAKIGQKIDKSVLGAYIKKQNEMILAQALTDSCINAKMCSQSSMINNQGRRKIEKIINYSKAQLNERIENNSHQK